VLQDPAFKRSFFPSVPVDKLRGVYRLEWGETGRVAGHPVRNLKVLPDDEFRYGYSLWLDLDSRLLLKWELLDINRTAIARLLFTNFRYGSEVDVNELNSSKPRQKFNVVESSLPQGNTVADPGSSWKAVDLPDGFELTDHRYASGADEEVYEHLVYGDGLAAVSVYIESSDGESVSGISSMGTTHAFTRRDRAVKITVIGDVPAATVLKIGRGVRSERK
jgi:sigma-E factor negative regulatory protein RseB